MRHTEQVEERDPAAAAREGVTPPPPTRRMCSTPFRRTVLLSLQTGPAEGCRQCAWRACLPRIRALAPATCWRGLRKVLCLWENCRSRGHRPVATPGCCKAESVCTRSPRGPVGHAGRRYRQTKSAPHLRAHEGDGRAGAELKDARGKRHHPLSWHSGSAARPSARWSCTHWKEPPFI